MKRLLLALLIMLPVVPAVFAQDVIFEPDIDGAAAAVGNDPAARQALEAECIASLSESTPFPERYRAIRILAIIGGEQSIAPLAALLNDAIMGHLARGVLEVMPDESARQALRDALGTTSGPQRLGVIASLTFLRDASSVASLSKLVADADVEAALSAVNALGHIATPEALEVLKPLVSSDNSDIRLGAMESMLVAAKYVGGDSGAEMYRHLLAAEAPDHVRLGAFTGLLAAQPEQALDNVLNAIGSKDELQQLTAIASLETLADADVTKRLAGLLPTLAGDRQALVINALAGRDDQSVLPLLHRALEGGSEDARLAAMRAIAVHGDVSSIQPLCRIIEQSDNRQEKMAAVETLRRLHGDDVDAVLIKRMQQAPEAVRGDLMDVLAQRNAVIAVDTIMEQVQHESLRPAAFRALTHITSREHLPEMITLLGKVEGDTGRSEAENALAALCQRISQTEGSLQITKAMYGDLPSGPARDVTAVIAKGIKGGFLSIDANNSNFGDAAPNTVKKLQVDYVLNGVADSKTVSENQTLTLQSDALPPALAGTLTQALEKSASPAEKVSLLRVLSRLGGTAAYELVVAHLDDDDAVIRDGAIRALANWPDAQAIGKLSYIFMVLTETAHRMAALRGCVRLLRLGELDVASALSHYERLVGAAQTADERKLLLSGLAEVSVPEAITLAAAMLEDGSVQAEAALAVQRIGDAAGMTEEQVQAAKAAGAASNPSADAGEFVPIFDGKTLDGWTGEPSLWRVEDGHIIGETTKDNPAKVNTFLIWEKGEVSDFELTFRYKIDSKWANSGIQIRSERFEGYRVRGYQPDISNEDWITGICYEEGGRGILARRGQKVTLGEGDAKEVEQFADEKELGALINANDWNEYHIVAKGNHFVSTINGHVMHEIIDNSSQVRLRGILAFQLHVGEPMKIRIADIMLKQLSSE